MAAAPSSAPTVTATLAWTGFELEGQGFALPAAQVLRVLPAGPVTRLPFAPPGVEGVSSVSGDVVPVLALAGLLFPDRPPPARPGAHFMIVLVAGERFALRIDRILFVAATLSPDTDGETRWQGEPVTCLDPQALGLSRLQPSRPPAGSPGAIAAIAVARAGSDPAPEATTAILVVEAAGHHYGVPSGSALELLEHVALTPLPLVPPALAGIVVLRRQPLLAFSLDRLLGGGGDARPGGYVVLSVGRSRVVLLVEAILGLRRLDAASSDRPKMLDPATLIPADLLALARGLPGTAEAPAGRDTSRQRFLCVSLGSRTYALALAAVERVLPPRQSVILPAGAPPGVDGAIEYGGRIVPVTDGWRWLSLGEKGTTGAHIVLRQDGEQRVLAVNGVQRIVTIAREDILPTTDHDPRIAALGTANGRPVEILSTAALMSRQVAA